MSRSAADATRFTATGPYASSKPSPSRLPYNLPSFMQKKQPNLRGRQGGAGTGSGTDGKETPREKVERLRAEARAARMTQSSLTGVDRMIEVGRRVANKAHKSMVYALIATSGVCGVLTVYAMVSLAMYNKRQRAAWLDKELEKLQQARLAYANDTATDEQIEILRNEKIGEILKKQKDAEREKRPWNRAKQFLFGGMKSDEEPSEQIQSQAQPETLGRPDEKLSVLEAVNAKAGENKGKQPGQLDVLADNTESAIKQSSKSWFSWLTGR